MSTVLGVSAYYHDAAAAIVRDGTILAAAQQERFSRVKNDPRLPADAIASCLRVAGLEAGDLDSLVFYEKPLTKLHRVLTTFVEAGWRGRRAFRTALPNWVNRNLWIGYDMERTLRRLGDRRRIRMQFAEHHASHAASAFYPSPFEHAAILTVDGVGEWTTASIGVGRGHHIRPLAEMRFPHSVGLLYSAFTEYCGFQVNEGEYKLMGLAPYGTPSYRDAIREHLVDVGEDGSIRLDMDCFAFQYGLTTTGPRFHDRFGGPSRSRDEPLTQRHADLAASIQSVTEEILLRMARHAKALTGAPHLCLAGGVALNAVANRRLLEEGPFEDLWVQPAAGDAGGAIGAALIGAHASSSFRRVEMTHAYLGPTFSTDEIAGYLRSMEQPFERVENPSERADRVAELLDDGAVLGVVMGRMEFGPRALGHRSILADPRRPDMQELINVRIKGRESFRPFAPSVLAEHAALLFEGFGAAPFMTRTALVRGGFAVAGGLSGASLANVAGPIPAVTHVDGSARLQTVDQETSPGYYAIIDAFRRRTGCPAVLNTSFNGPGEPIVCTPADAYECFVQIGLDYLLIEDMLVDRRTIPSHRRKRMEEV